jgi:ADP-heptose:LPS heptosyltransferase
MRPEGWQSVDRVLVVRLDNVGDVVMLGPALRALRDTLPGVSLTLLASPAGSQVAPLLPWLDDVLVQRASWQQLAGTGTLAYPAGQTESRPNVGVQQDLALVERLRSRKFDAAVIFTSFAQSPYPPAYACYMAGIPIRLGQSKEFGGMVLSQWVKPLPDETHQAERNMHLLEAAGFAIPDRSLAIHVRENVQAAADGLLRQVGVDPLAPFVALAPGASAAARRYTPDRYAVVAQRLAARTGWPVVVLGSSREGALAQPILSAGAPYGVRSLVGETTVPEMAGVIRRAALLLANDSGPMHLGDALGRPMVILYAGTEHESQWRPRRAPHRLLRRPTPCAPCYAFHCPFGGECLDIPAEEVVEAALALLERESLWKPEPLSGREFLSERTPRPAPTHTWNI